MDEAHLVDDEVFDEPSAPNWRRRLLGEHPANVIARATGQKYAQIAMTPWMARLLTTLAAERELSREAYLRRVIAQHVSTVTDLSVDGAMLGLIPRRPDRNDTPLPPAPDTIDRAEQE